MQLAKKKQLAARVLKVGKDRVIFMNDNLSEIKEAITRQDILDLHKAGAIKIREIAGRRTIEKRRNRRRTGKVKNKARNTKQEYVKITRKLRTYGKFLFKTKQISKEKHHNMRKLIRARKFKSKRHLNEILGEISNE